MHEIITIQLGQQANYLGTHYWNTQESYFTYGDDTESQIDHDRSFRQGIGVDGADTYTPRALVYDLKNAFGSLRRDNALYNDQRPEDLLHHNAWGQTATMQLAAIPESVYQQAINAGTHPEELQPSSVRYWSDYNHVYYHPRSMIQLNDYEVNSALMPFEQCSTGEELFASLDKEHDLLDRDLRPLLEGCDQLQAINVIASTTDAWGGFASQYLEKISDELGKNGRWLFGLQDNSPADRARQSTRLVNTVQCLEAATPYISLNLPLISPIRATHPWQTSAVQAVAVESLTLPTRLKQSLPGSATAHELEQTLNLDGHRALVTTGMNTGRSEQTPTQDTRMTNGVAHDEEIDTEQTMQLDLFPAAPTTSRRPARRHNRLFSSISIDRRADGVDGSETNNAGTHFTDRIALPFPELTSFPKGLLASNGLTVDAKVISSTAERVAWYVRDCATASHALLPAEVREDVYDGLISMAEEYEDSMDFSDLDEMDDD